MDARMSDLDPNQRRAMLERGVAGVGSAEPSQHRARSTVKPRVTVVLPTYRRSAYLARAIAAVQAQTLTVWELIVVDDNDPAHPDRQRTQDQLSAHLHDRRIDPVLHTSNRGAAAARNTGIRAAQGAWISFLDDDDEWHPTKLERQLARAEASPDDVALVYCRTRNHHAVNGRVSDYRAEPEKCTVRDLLRRNHIGGTSCIMCRASVLRDVGMFDESLASRQDIDLYVRVAAASHAFAFVDDALVTMNLHGQQRISTNVWAKVAGHRRFFEKHKVLIESDSTALRARLTEMGRCLLAAHELIEARRVLSRAWQLEVRDRVVLKRLLLTYPIVRSMRAALRQLHDQRSDGNATRVEHSGAPTETR